MSSLPIIMHLDGSCRRSTLQSGDLPSTDQLISIDLPVGLGFKAKNLPTDVRTIQNALNKVPLVQGGPKVPLDPDGKCGPKTIKAIQDFQLRHFDWPGTDGLIEPGKQTINRLNQVLFANLPVDPAINIEIRARVISNLDLVSRAIKAAQMNILLARSPGGGIDLGKGRANDRLDRHFALNTLPSSQRSQALNTINRVYEMYNSVLLMPGSLGAGAFEVDPSGDPRIAFAFAGGFFLKEQIDPRRNIRMDRIYLGRRAFFAINDRELCAFIMLHEMAHFVGTPGGGRIDDHGRGWFTDSTIKPLTAQLRIQNADSYAGFATECRTGTDKRPPYVKAATSSR